MSATFLSVAIVSCLLCSRWWVDSGGFTITERPEGCSGRRIFARPLAFENCAALRLNESTRNVMVGSLQKGRFFCDFAEHSQRSMELAERATENEFHGKAFNVFR